MEWKHARAGQLARLIGRVLWHVWLILAGRGWGKTRTGAEWAADKARKFPGCRVALVAATFADVRDVMVEGESGLLAVLDPSELRGGSVDTAWNRSMGELFLANGSRFKAYSSEKPRQLRGPQNHFGWADEIAQWNDAVLGAKADPKTDTTWSNLVLNCRLTIAGSEPQIVATTTPRPVALLRSHDDDNPGLTQLANSAITRGHTDENTENLASSYVENVIDPMRGTRLGEQELAAVLLDEGVGIFDPSTFRYWSFVESHEQDTGLVYGSINSVGRLEVIRPVDCWRFMTVDLAGSVRTSADWTVASAWAVNTDGRMALIGRRRVQVETTDHFALIQGLAVEVGGVEVVCIETGMLGFDVLVACGAAGIRVAELKPDRDKVTRAIPAVRATTDGRVWFPGKQVAPWIGEWVGELEQFPNPRVHDDQVDTLSYAVDYVNKHGRILGPLIATPPRNPYDTGYAGASEYDLLNLGA